MIPRLTPARRGLIVAALGSSLTVSWASSYYIPAVLAVPMAEDLGLSPVWVFGAFSMAMVVSAMVGPWAGARIDGVGGRGVLMLSNLVFAAGLALLAVAPTPVVLFAGWAVIGLGMGIGLYEAGFATLAGIYGKDARGPITGITLIAGFASTVGWPLSGLMLATWGWREACVGWALIHLVVALAAERMTAEGHRKGRQPRPVDRSRTGRRRPAWRSGCSPSSLRRPGSTRPRWPRTCRGCCKPPGPARLSPSRPEPSSARRRSPHGCWSSACCAGSIR